MRITTLVMLALVTSATDAGAQPKKSVTDLPKEDQERVAAARLLFGTGLNVTEDKATKLATLDPDPKVVDEKTLRHYIVAYYREALRKATSWPNPPSINGRVYDNAVRAGGDAWVLSEPFTRKTMCINIANGIKDREYRKWTEDYCGYSATYFTTSSLVEFRGTKVTWPADKPYHGDLTFDTKLWDGAEDKLDPVVVVPGVAGFVVPQRVSVQEALLVTIPADSWAFASAQKIKARNKEWITKWEAAVAELEKKQRGKNGGVVVFGTEWFHGWKPVEAKTGTLDCEAVYWKGYGPLKFAKTDEDYEWTVSVDKNSECQTGRYDDEMPAVVLGGPVFASSPDDCSQHLITAGKHKISIAMWQLKYKKTGELRTRVEANGDITVNQRSEASRGKLVAKGAITCETNGDSLAKQFSYTNTR